MWSPKHRARILDQVEGLRLLEGAAPVEHAQRVAAGVALHEHAARIADGAAWPGWRHELAVRGAGRPREAHVHDDVLCPLGSGRCALSSYDVFFQGPLPHGTEVRSGVSGGNLTLSVPGTYRIGGCIRSRLNVYQAVPQVFSPDIRFTVL